MKSENIKIEILAKKGTHLAQGKFSITSNCCFANVTLNSNIGRKKEQIEKNNTYAVLTLFFFQDDIDFSIMKGIFFFHIFWNYCPSSSKECQINVILK